MVVAIPVRRRLCSWTAFRTTPPTLGKSNFRFRFRVAVAHLLAAPVNMCRYIWCIETGQHSKPLLIALPVVPAPGTRA